MEQGIFVDVLLVTNYIINMLLITCAGKISGRSLKRRRIVAAALLGAATSLTIFLPFMSFFMSALIKLAASSAIVLTAFPYTTATGFFKQLFLFFIVSFFFAGVMLGIWLMFTPKGMTYYNGVVYFDISPFLLIATTAVAYILIWLYGRFARGKNPERAIYKVTICINGKTAKLEGLLDTGNHLTEPFSGTPVVVCEAAKLYNILPADFINAVISNSIYNAELYSFGIRVRMIPYSNVGGSSVMAAVKADYIRIEKKSEICKVEQVYIGLSPECIGDETYSMLLNPDLKCFEIDNKTKKVALNI